MHIHEPGPFEGRIERWPVLAATGPLEVRLAETEAEVEAAQRLRYRVFYEELAAIPSPAMRDERRDFDRFDQFCDHLLVVDRSVHDDDGQPAVVGTYRLLREAYLTKSGGYYTAGEFDLAPMLAAWPQHARFLELGRSCIVKAYRNNASTMQLLWRGLMAYVARFSCELMFGCASFSGTDPKELALPLSYLHHFYGMPPEVRVRARPELYVEMNLIPKNEIDPKQAMRTLPALIRGYLRAGCTIGEGAVIDYQFGTTDVLIYLPVAKMDSRYMNRFGHSA